MLELSKGQWLCESENCSKGLILLGAIKFSALFHLHYSLQPSLNLPLSITKRIIDAAFLAAHFISVFLRNIPRLCRRIVVPVRVLEDLFILQLLVWFAVCALVDVDDDCTAEAEIVLQCVCCVDVAVVRPA